MEDEWTALALPVMAEAVTEILAPRFPATRKPVEAKIKDPGRGQRFFPISIREASRGLLWQPTRTYAWKGGHTASTFLAGS